MADTTDTRNYFNHEYYNNFFHNHYTYCIKHGYQNNSNECVGCAQERELNQINVIEYKSFGDLYQQAKINKENEKMAKVELTADQKATIVYARAKGLSNEQIITLYIVGKLTPTNLDQTLATARLIEAYDPETESEDAED